MKLRMDLPHADGTTTPILLERSTDSPDGRRHWVSRSRVPIDGALIVRDVATVAKIQTPEDGRSYHDDDEDKDKDRAYHDGMVLEGIASSTSVDWHGTAMSREALESMADQFRSGVPYVPAHHRDEWDEVMGTTYEAEIVDSSEGLPTMLQVRTRLYQDDPRTKQLVERLRDGMTIGQSIGGWFTELDVVTNDQDEVESITIRGVELDHLAVTRRPSNPDSYIARLLMDGTRAIRAATNGSPVESTIQPGNHPHEWTATQEDQDVVRVSLGRVQRSVPTQEVEGRSMETEDDRATAEVEAPDGHHWMDLQDGPVLMEGTDADHPGASATFPFEVVDPEDLDPDQINVDEEPAEGDPMERAATEYVDLPMAPMDTEWDWDTDAQDAVLYEGRDEDDPDWERYAKAHTWMDPDADPETKEAYKLPKAMMMDGDLHVVFRGVVAAMAALNGARGGVDIPEEDRQGVYDHLVRCYEKFDRDPPELRHAPVQHGPIRVAGYMDLPMDEVERTWTWTAQDQETILEMDGGWQAYQLAHLSYNPETPEDRESYRFPFARMVDGELRASMDAITQIMTRLVDLDEDVGLPGSLRAHAYEHLARYYTKAGEQPPTMPVAQSSQVQDVDTRSTPCSNSTVGSDAHGSAPLAIHSPKHASEVRTMSEQINTPAEAPEVDRLSRLESLLERTVTTVAALAESQANPPAPEAPAVEEATPSADAEVESLRARLQEMEQTITRMASAPVRSGRPHSSAIHRDLPSTGYSMVVREAGKHLPEASALVAVARDQETRRAAGMDTLPSRRSLENDLRSILNAALVDGVITDPDTRANWS